MRRPALLCAPSKSHNDDRDLPTIQELLLTKLQEQGFVAEDRTRQDKTGLGVKEATAKERGGSIDHNGFAPGDNSGRSLRERPLSSSK
jgi:hypothetical protein